MTYTGKHNYGLFEIESTYGTAADPDKDFGLLQNVTPTASNNLEEIKSLSTRLTQQIIAGNYEGNLTLEFVYQHARILQLAFGTTPTHSQTSSDWEHTIVDAGNALPVAEDPTYFTYEDGFNSTSDEINFYIGCLIANCSLSVEIGGKLTVRANAPYQSTDDTTVTTAVISTLPVFPSFACTLLAGTEGSESALAKVQTAEFTFETVTLPIWGLGSREKAEEQWDDFRVRYRYTLAFNNNAEYERFKGSTTTPSVSATPDSFGVKFLADNGIALGSGKRAVEMQLRGCVHNDWSQPVNIGGIVIAEFSGVSDQVYLVKGTDNIADTAF